MAMDMVKSFNSELSSLYEMKPPISKAKMTAITKGAIKAAKFYKHVVQSVEKFLQKCRPEYKIPGLYVIDSIVRQSRHQFGADKDVFAPRFAKNINFTFFSIYQCTNEEKSKVIRVLNLWQKNAVFPPEVIQPLFDMADSSHPKYKEVALIISSKALSSSNKAGSGGALSSIGGGASSSQEHALNGNREASMGGFDDNSNDGGQAQQALVMGNLPNLSSTEMSLATRLQHLQHLFGQEPSGGNGTGNNSATPAGGPSPVKGPPTAASDTGQIRFNKKLLDFDYDEEDEEPGAAQQQQPPVKAPPPPVTQQPTNAQSGASDTLGSLLANPDILRHLQSLQQQITQPGGSGAAAVSNHREPGGWQEVGVAPHQPPQLQQYPQDFSQPPPGFVAMGMAHQSQSNQNHPIPGMTHPPIGFGVQLQQQQQPPSHPTIREDLFPAGSNGQVIDVEPPRTKERDRRRSRSRSGSRNRNSGRGGGGSSRHRRGSRSRSRDRSRRRTRSRSPRTSPSGGRGGRPTNGRRARTRSRDREEREKERLEREKERERRRRGLPPVKKEFLSVCSTTLWVGHLSKLVQQEELSDTFGQYGEITSIDLIPPRGCAFVCMHRRQDAYRALTKLAGQKLQGKAITLAWAPGKGVKAKEWKDFWEVDQGVSYIPWSKLSNMTDLVALEEGGSFDEETLPPWMRHLHQQPQTAGMETQVDMLHPQQQMMTLAPPVFMPMPDIGAGGGPPTPTDLERMGHANSALPRPEMPTNTGPSPSLNAATTLPPNLPTYGHPSAAVAAAAAAMAGPMGLLPGHAAGLMPLGMPGLRLPPPALGLLGPAGNNILGQSILAGMNAAAAAAAAASGPPGFFNVFSPHLAGGANPQPPPPHAVGNHPPAGEQGDDMELEEADDDPHHHHQQHKDHHGGAPTPQRRSWNSGESRDPHQPDGANKNATSLLDRLRSLANHDVPGGGPSGGNSGPRIMDHHIHPNGPPDMDRMGDSAVFGMSPNLASSLRGAPLTAAGAPPGDLGHRLMRGNGNNGPPEPFHNGGRMGGDEPGFMHRHLGPPHFGGDPFGPPMRGGMNPHSPRGGHFDGRGGGRGFESWDPRDEEQPPLPPPPRWRGADPDWDRDRDRCDRDSLAPRHWDRDRDLSRRGDWTSPRGGGRPPQPPLPPRSADRDRGGGRDRFQRDRNDRNDRHKSGERSSERERGGDSSSATAPRSERKTGERRPNRWSNRTPDPPAEPVATLAVVPGSTGSNPVVNVVTEEPSEPVASGHCEVEPSANPSESESTRHVITPAGPDAGEATVFSQGPADSSSAATAPEPPSSTSTRYDDPTTTQPPSASPQMPKVEESAIE